MSGEWGSGSGGNLDVYNRFKPVEEKVARPMPEGEMIARVWMKRFKDIWEKFHKEKNGENKDSLGGWEDQ